MMALRPSEEGILLFEERFMDPTLSTGLWWVGSMEDVRTYSINCVCLSEFHRWDEVRQLNDWLQQWTYIFVASPDRELVEKVRYYVRGIPVLSPAATAFKGCTRLSEYIVEHGIANVEELLFGAQMEPVYGILELSKVDITPPAEQKRIMSKFQYLDGMTGGFRPGELSVWTGKRGEGKSTLLSQVLLEAIDQGERVMAYSGELPARQFKTWTMLQAASLEEIEGVRPSYSERLEYHVKPKAMERINADWKGKFFLIDINADYAHNEDMILENFLYARRVLGCTTFLVDNIMTAQLTGDRDFYRAQSKFAQRLSRFAKANNAHVHLVAHPRKTPSDRPVTDGDDISGSGDIANLADNAFSVRRIPDDEVDKSGCDALLYVLKCRETGRRGKVRMEFDARRRRYSGVKESWAKNGVI